MKKIILFLAIVCFIVIQSFGQNVDRSVIASAGTEMAASSYYLSFTLGELVVDSYNSGGYELSEGFQQSDISLQSVQEQFLLDVVLFPNPSSDVIYLEVGTQNEMQFSLFDAAGRLLLQKTFFGKTSIQSSEYANGMYLLRITDLEEGQSNVYKVEFH